MSEVCFESLLERAKEKILLAQELIHNLEEFKHLKGVQRVQKNINQEVKFLEKAIKNETLSLNNVQGSNLTHFDFLIKVLRLQRDVVHLDCSFRLETREKPLRVDIVCENGLKWVKVVARKPKSLLEVVKGGGSYGARSILDQAEEYVEATAQHLCMFKRPKIVFYFSNNLENELLNELQEIGVDVATIKQPDTLDFSSSSDLTCISTLNLDITTLLAYISAVCNDGANWIFTEAILTEQAERERQKPLKPILDKLFEGKRLICCETAFKSFQSIINLLAGPKELQRAAELMQRVEVLPDVAAIPEELTVIRLSGKINERSLKIFSFGVHMKALTVTSNKAFVRSAKMQGINVPVFTHDARAMTELKEQTGTPID